MDKRIEPFVPPHPEPRTVPPSTLEVIRTALRNPLELWGVPAYSEKYIKTKFLNERSIIANDPDLIRYVLVDNARNYRMATIRQLVLRPILRDGLLTAEGETWKRSRKAMAPVFTPRHIAQFADVMLEQCLKFCERFEPPSGQKSVQREISQDMTELTYEILASTLFSNQIVGDQSDFANDVGRLLHTMGRIDPLDMLKAPKWIPRPFRTGGKKVMAKFRGMVRDTAEARRKAMRETPQNVPQDFLTLLLRAQGPNGLTFEEIEDNIITFIGAGHETTARALGWTLYCLANAPQELDLVLAEIDDVLMQGKLPPPVEWLDRLVRTRAAFEEAMRLYPPAPSINRAAISDDRWGDLEIRKDETVLVMPWTVHRHRALWDEPDAFVPSRFWPENRIRLHRFQYLPFGAGPRICIGATFALQEAVIALGVMLSRYRFDMAADAPAPWPVQKLTTQPEGGLHMIVTRRT
jgi:cytochrome P450